MTDSETIDSILRSIGKNASSEARCKRFAEELFNRPLEWKGDPYDGMGYYSTEITVEIK